MDVKIDMTRQMNNIQNHLFLSHASSLFENLLFLGKRRSFSLNEASVVTTNFFSCAGSMDRGSAILNSAGNQNSTS
jgi:hypothetical protein